MLEGNGNVQINKTDNTQAGSLLDSLVSRRPGKASEQGRDDLKMEPRYSQLVSQAMSAEDDAAVAQAKALLESGALDSPEAARAAASNMLKLGI